MTNNYYDETRQNKIMQALANEKLLQETELYKREELPAFISFSDALVQATMMCENSSYLNIRNLSSYIQEQAEHFGLSNDREIRYTVDQIEKLATKIHILKRGAAGEGIANRAMFGINAPNRILKNLEYTIDGMFFEIDTIVINQNGVCVVEVKNFKRDLLIDEAGELVAADNPDESFGNIRTKLNNEAAVARRIIETAFPNNAKMLALAEKIPVVLLSTGGLITDTYGEFTIADCDNIAALLNNLPCMYSLSRDEINELAAAFENAVEMRKYPIRYDYERVAKAFSIAIAKLEYASEHNMGVQVFEKANDEINTERTDIPEIEKVAKEKDPNTPKEKPTGWQIAAAVALGIVVLGVGMLFSDNDF